MQHAFADGFVLEARGEVRVKGADRLLARFLLNRKRI